MSVSSRLLSREIAAKLSAGPRRDVLMKGLACYSRGLQTKTQDVSEHSL